MGGRRLEALKRRAAFQRLAHTIALALMAVGFSSRADDGFRAVSLEEMQVTLGELKPLDNGAMVVDAPKVRAVTKSRARRAELAIRYLGPTGETAPLGSGRVRRQAGLKLLARDGCNVLYVMWRMAPEPGVFVQLKHNPAARRHEQCGNRGYRTVRPFRAVKVPPPQTGRWHTLRAELDGELLTAWLDGHMVWFGRVGREAALLEGPLGLRTDNGRFELKLRVPEARPPSR